MPLSAASARSREGLLRVTLIVLAAGALVTPALGSGGSGGHGLPPPTDLEVLGATRTSLTWRWESSATAQAYRVYEDGRFVGSTTSPEFTLDGLDCGRGYVLAVETLDADGRYSSRLSVIAPSAPCAAVHVARPASTPEPALTEHPSAPAAQAAAPAPTPEPSQPIYPLTEPAQPAEPASTPGEAPSSIWQTAGVFVWHEAAVDPEALGRQLKENGFGWAAVQLHDGLTPDPVQDDWVQRFREASGLPVGGWGVLRTQPVAEAQLAQTLLARHSLDFYIADAESEYKYTGDDGLSGVRYERSRQFVDAFRAALPDMPAAVSSYCRANRADIDWATWAEGGFDFLPQAYVNDLGDAVTPAACTEAAAPFFPADAVHPTIGLYASHDDEATPETYTKLLQDAHTVGFSVYLAETQKDPQAWSVLGKAIDAYGIARNGSTPVVSEPATAAAPLRERLRAS